MTAAHAAYRAAAPPLPEAPQGRDETILAELPQVYFIAARIRERLPASVQMEDLVNAGVVGLIEAYNSFDHTRKAQFRTFARFRIRGAILDSLRVLDWGSRSLRRRAREIAETSHRLENSLGRRPSNEEVAAEMRIPLEQIEMALTQLDSLQIVNQQATSSFDGEELYDLIESAPSLQEGAYDIFVRNERRAQLAQAIAALNEREQLVLSLYYREELTMKQVAQVIGIALSRVSQIHTAAIGKLRATLTHPRSAGPAHVVEGAV
jgi:RNA polymerase sigma factor for flagellar operon FliA